MTAHVRTVDLFCGCGGLSLGFELHRKSVRFEVVLGLDNSDAAVRCNNANRTERGGQFKTARACDLTWFNNQSEILLFYLIHYAHWSPDVELWDSLNSPPLNVRGYLKTVQTIDQDFAMALQQTEERGLFTDGLRDVDSSVFTIAIAKSLFSRLGLSTPRNRAGIRPASQPWAEEYGALSAQLDGAHALDDPPEELTRRLRSKLADFYDKEVLRLREASKKRGRGLNATVPPRIQGLVKFLESRSGKRLRSLWLQWRSRRDSIRASFTNNAAPSLAELYESRRVGLLLGGPPCKGFSRAGRPVAVSLTEQGTYSWSSNEFLDERNALLFKYVLMISALRPRVFVFENVENFKSQISTSNGSRMDPPAVLAEAIEDLSADSLHYDIRSGLLKASNFGIPQSRIRYFMVGFLQGLIPSATLDGFFDLAPTKSKVPLKAALDGLSAPLEFVHGASRSAATEDEVEAYTLCDSRMPDEWRQYVRWIRQDHPCRGSTTKTDAHLYRRPRADDLALIRKFAPGQRWMDYRLKSSHTLDELRNLLSLIKVHRNNCAASDLPSAVELADLLDRIDSNLFLRLLLEDLELPMGFEGDNHLLAGGYLKRGTGSHGDWFERMSALKPSKTIVAHIGKDTYGYIHPWEDRPISMREAARIQTFPDFFRFGSAGVVEGYAMIGDAVPPLLSFQIAERVSTLQKDLGVLTCDEPKPNRPNPAPRRDKLSQTAFRF